MRNEKEKREIKEVEVITSEKQRGKGPKAPTSQSKGSAMIGESPERRRGHAVPRGYLHAVTGWRGVSACSNPVEYATSGMDVSH